MQGKLIHLTARRALALLCVSVLIAANLFVFGPFTIYSGNVDEFTVSFLSILGFLSIPALVFVALLFAVGLFLPDGAYRRYIAILFALGLLIWIQGNILVWKYGLLAGQGIDWTKDSWRGLVDGAAWVLILGVSLFFYRHLHKVALIAGIALISTQFLYVGFASVRNSSIWKKQSLAITPPPKEIYEFSASQNVIHIILDGFKSDIFSEIINQNPDYYSNAFEGFTFFKGATSAFPSTLMSIPSILSGQTYKNDAPIPDFLNKVLEGKTIPNVLYDNGYAVDTAHYSNNYYMKGRYSSTYLIPIPYAVSPEEHLRASAATMLDLVLFRHAPHHLKKLIFNDQQWLLQRAIAKKETDSHYQFAHAAFLEDVIEYMTATRRVPVYKFFHLMTSHAPPVYNDKCEYAGSVLPLTKDNLIQHDRCALNHLIRFFQKLKSSGIYESSLIVINADHGYRYRNSSEGANNHLKSDYGGENSLSAISSYAMPLMAVKPPHGRGLLRVSNVQASLADIPATISSLMNIDAEFEGKSVFDLSPDEARARKFYYYNYDHQDGDAKYITHLDEYIIEGSVFDMNSWHAGKTYLPAGSSYEVSIIDFGSSDAYRFMRGGWSSNQDKKYTWALGGNASLFLTLPREKPVVLTAVIKSMSFDESQHITVRLDGEKIAVWRLSPPWTFEKRDVIIAPREKRPAVSILDFSFSQNRIPADDDRPLAVLFKSIALDDFHPYPWGDPVTFGKAGNSAPYLSGGWSDTEAEVTWTSGKAATLVIPVAPPRSNFITLKATFNPFIFPGKVDRQTVRILVNGRKAGTWDITKPGLQEQTLRIPASLLSNPCSLDITFDLPDAISPAEVGYNQDRRVLALAFRSLELSDE